MKEFKAVIINNIQSLPSMSDIFDLIHATNSTGSVYADPIHVGTIIAVCDNKPMDSPIDNIKWEEC